MAKKTVIVECLVDGWTKQLQLSMSVLDEDGTGSGFRLSGPKFNGSSKVVTKAVLDRRAADEIRGMLDKVFPVRPDTASNASPET